MNSSINVKPDAGLQDPAESTEEERFSSGCLGEGHQKILPSPPGQLSSPMAGFLVYDYAPYLDVYEQPGFLA